MFGNLRGGLPVFKIRFSKFSPVWDVAHFSNIQTSNKHFTLSYYEFVTENNDTVELRKSLTLRITDSGLLSLISDAN